MRIWSLHPCYLDTKGLVALWRETLLAKHVLEGKTRGYTNHPQLNRFKNSKKPLDNINFYLSVIHQEASCRNYCFDNKKVNWDSAPEILTVTDSQLTYEVSHLLSKLKLRDPRKYRELKKIELFKSHPLFSIIPGNIESWEIITQPSNKRLRK
jgi:hypothetical protein